MLKALLGDVRSSFSRQNIVQNVVSLLVFAAISLVWPTVVRFVSDVSLWYLIPLAIAGFLALAALVLWRSDNPPAEPAPSPPRSAAHSSAEIRRAVLPLLTELRDIRHKIHLVRSTRPHPHYSKGFRFPGFRWEQYHQLLAHDPDLYRVVEAAYTAAHHTNEVLAFRETRAKPGATLAETSDEKLDVVDALAADAVEALEALADGTKTRRRSETITSAPVGSPQARPVPALSDLIDRLAEHRTNIARLGTPRHRRWSSKGLGSFSLLTYALSDEAQLLEEARRYVGRYGSAADSQRLRDAEAMTGDSDVYVEQELAFLDAVSSVLLGLQKRGRL